MGYGYGERNGGASWMASSSSLHADSDISLSHQTRLLSPSLVVVECCCTFQRVSSRPHQPARLSPPSINPPNLSTHRLLASQGQTSVLLSACHCQRTCPLLGPSTRPTRTHSELRLTSITSTQFARRLAPVCRASPPVLLLLVSGGSGGGRGGGGGEGKSIGEGGRRPKSGAGWDFHGGIFILYWNEKLTLRQGSTVCPRCRCCCCCEFIFINITVWVWTRRPLAPTSFIRSLVLFFSRSQSLSTRPFAFATSTCEIKRTLRTGYVRASGKVVSSVLLAG